MNIKNKNEININDKENFYDIDKQSFLIHLKQIRRKCFDTLQAYTPGEQPKKPEEWIKLNTNENPYDPPKKVIKSLQEAVKYRLKRYPDPLALELRKKIGNIYFKRYSELFRTEYLKEKKKKSFAEPENIIVANGSDEILDIVFKTFIEPGDRVNYCSPSYGMYPVLAETYEAKKNEIKLEKDFSLNVDKLVFNSKDKLFFLCSPNNPNGGSFPLETIDKLCDKFPGIVFVDEAYADFSKTSAVQLIPKHPNLVVGRTFSKSMSLAAIRLGIAIGWKEIIDLFHTIRLPYNVSYLSQVAGIAALESWDEIEKNIESIKNTRETTIRTLEELGYNIFPSASNFFMLSFDSQEKAKDIFEELKKQRILVRYWNKRQLNKYVRVTIGTNEEMAKFVSVMENLVNINTNK